MNRRPLLDGDGDCAGDKLFEQQAPSGGMLEERHNQLAMVIEARRAPDNRHHAVGPRQLEQPIDLVIVQPLRNCSQRKLGSQL